MKIATKVIAWEQTDLTAKNFWFFYKAIQPNETPVFGYEDPHIVIPAVEGQTEYQLQIPGQLALTEGTYALGVAAADAEGNLSDITTLVRFFDFTAPAAPQNLRVL